MAESAIADTVATSISVAIWQTFTPVQAVFRESRSPLSISLITIKKSDLHRCVIEMKEMIPEVHRLVGSYHGNLWKIAFHFPRLIWLIQPFRPF